MFPSSFPRRSTSARAPTPMLLLLWTLLSRQRRPSTRMLRPPLDRKRSRSGPDASPAIAASKRSEWARAQLSLAGCRSRTLPLRLVRMPTPLSRCRKHHVWPMFFSACRKRTPFPRPSPVVPSWVSVIELMSSPRLYCRPLTHSMTLLLSSTVRRKKQGSSLPSATFRLKSSMT